MIVVSDSTILIGLAKIGKLELLRKIFSKVYIPEEVFNEVVEKGNKNLGLLKEIKSSIEELKRKRFRISDKTVEEALRKAGG
jgi:predicted nucleic acid-binding protein